jgi:hypothetical protein
MILEFETGMLNNTTQQAGLHTRAQQKLLLYSETVQWFYKYDLNQVIEDKRDKFVKRAYVLSNLCQVCDE